ncbi:hypothetical protein GCM10009557_91210 [Virgisporangium ochraceum]
MVAPDSGAPWFTLRMCEFPEEYLATAVGAQLQCVSAARDGALGAARGAPR